MEKKEIFFKIQLFVKGIKGKNMAEDIRNSAGIIIGPVNLFSTPVVMKLLHPLIKES